MARAARLAWLRRGRDVRQRAPAGRGGRGAASALSAHGGGPTEEPESVALAARLDGWVAQGWAIASSLMLETELRRMAQRLAIAQERVSDLLDRFDLLEPDALTHRTAGLLPGEHVRSLDALHVAAALQGDCRTMVTYDLRQAEAARAAGLRIEAPRA